MAKEQRPYRANRAAFLQFVLEKAGGPKSLAAGIGTPDTHLTAMSKGRRGIGDDLAAKLERYVEAAHGTADMGATALEAELLTLFRGLPDDNQRAQAIGALKAVIAREWSGGADPRQRGGLQLVSEASPPLYRAKPELTGLGPLLDITGDKVQPQPPRKPVRKKRDAKPRTEG